MNPVTQYYLNKHGVILYRGRLIYSGDNGKYYIRGKEYNSLREAEQKIDSLLIKIENIKVVDLRDDD